MNKTIAAIALTIALAGCGSKGKEPEQKPQPAAVKPKPAPAKVTPKAPMTPAQVQQFHVSFEDAMKEIPPELRQQWQKLFECEIKKNAKLPAAQQRNFDGDAVRELTAQLKRDPHAGDTCAA